MKIILAGLPASQVAKCCGRRWRPQPSRRSPYCRGAAWTSGIPSCEKSLCETSSIMRLDLAGYTTGIWASAHGRQAPQRRRTPGLRH